MPNLDISGRSAKVARPHLVAPTLSMPPTGGSMHRQHMDPVADRSDHPNPTLYIAISGDVTWDRWRELRQVELILREIEFAAGSIAERVPRKTDPERGRKVRELHASLAMEELLDKLQRLPAELRPVRSFTKLRALAFCQALEARLLSSALRS